MDKNRLNDIVEFCLQIIAGIFGFSILYTITDSFFWACGGSSIVMSIALLLLLFPRTKKLMNKLITYILYFVILAICLCCSEYSPCFVTFSDSVAQILDLEKDNPWESENKALQYCDKNISVDNYATYHEKFPNTKNRIEIYNDLFKLIKEKGEKEPTSVLDFSDVDVKHNKLKVHSYTEDDNKITVFLKHKASNNLIVCGSNDTVILPFDDYELAFYKRVSKDSITFNYYHITVQSYGITFK